LIIYYFDIMKTINFRSTFLVLLILGVVMVLMSATINSGTKPGPMASLTGGEWVAPASADTAKNPLKGNIASIAEGKKIYAKYCVVCHGEKGKGDGIAAAGLTPRPADHSSEKIQKQSDGALFWKITTGRPPMASYKTFSLEQRWQVVNYIRTLNAPAKSKK
jgi:mono/diheme cytochrome c family protein